MIGVLLLCICILLLCICFELQRLLFCIFGRENHYIEKKSQLKKLGFCSVNSQAFGISSPNAVTELSVLLHHLQKIKVCVQVSVQNVMINVCSRHFISVSKCSLMSSNFKFCYRYVKYSRKSTAQYCILKI